MRKYKHRNGEMRVPEVPGYYWVFGVMRLPGESYDLAGCFYFATYFNKSLFAKIDGRFVVIGSPGVGYDYYPSGDWSDCRFWGPASAPWWKEM